MEIGFGMMEILAIATAITGVLWVLARLRPAAAARKPLWVRWGAELFFVCALIFVVRVGIIDYEVVPSGSMEPTVRVGDRLAINKLAYGPRLPFTNTPLRLGSPERGDIVVFRFPGNVSQHYVKRLVGLPGDVVTYADGFVRVEGQEFELRAAPSAVPQKAEDAGHQLFIERVGSNERLVKVDDAYPGGRVPPVAWQAAGTCEVHTQQVWRCVVPQGKYLMMGDNRDKSADSRVWGFLEEDQVYGKAVRVLVNFSQLSRTLLAL